MLRIQPGAGIHGDARHLASAEPARATSHASKSGYAVHEDYRGKGRAKALVKSAIAEFKNGFAGYPPIYLEAVIAKSNVPSMKVAETAFTSTAEEITDVFSGVPALLYRDLDHPGHDAHRSPTHRRS